MLGKARNKREDLVMGAVAAFLLRVMVNGRCEIKENAGMGTGNGQGEAPAFRNTGEG